MCRLPIWSQYITIHTLMVHRNVCYTVYNFHFFTQQVLLSKVPHSLFLPNQNFVLGIISILLWQFSYVCAMMWWLECIPRSFHKAYLKRLVLIKVNIKWYKHFAIVAKGLLNQPPLCFFLTPIVVCTQLSENWSYLWLMKCSLQSVALEITFVIQSVLCANESNLKDKAKH